MLSYQREQKSAETFGKGEALAVTLNYRLIKTNRPKIPKHTHRDARARKNVVCTRLLVLEPMASLEPFSTIEKSENRPGSGKMSTSRKVRTITTQCPVCV